MVRRFSFMMRLRQLRPRFWITFIVACFIAEGGEFLFEELMMGNTESHVSGSVIGLSGIYQRLVAAPRKPTVHYTAIVEIDPEKDIRSVSASNICAEREFLARLLRRIDRANPAVIVVDKYFGRTTCPIDDNGTKHLQEAVTDIRKNRDLIIGLRARPSDDRKRPDVKHSVLDESLDFGPDAQADHAGIINVAADNRRLPLQWLVYANSGPGSSPAVRDTLSLLAAKAYDPYLLEKNPRLEKFISRGEQPFIGFLTPSQFDRSHFYASEVVCGRRIGESEDWRACDPSLPLPKGISNRIVLVAESDRDRDEHHTVVGKIPGFYLQANYIEALLDDRFLQMGGSILDYGFGFFFLFWLELALVVWHHDAITALIFIVLLVVVAYVAVYVIVMHLHIYIDPVPVSAAAILIKVTHLAYSYVQGNPQSVRIHGRA